MEIIIPGMAKAIAKYDKLMGEKPPSKRPEIEAAIIMDKLNVEDCNK